MEHSRKIPSDLTQFWFGLYSALVENQRHTELWKAVIVIATIIVVIVLI